MPVAAGLNQKNSTSLMLGTRTAFDFHLPSADLTPCCNRPLYPKMVNGARKNLSNLVSSIIAYLWDTTPAPLTFLIHQPILSELRHSHFRRNLSARKLAFIFKGKELLFNYCPTLSESRHCRSNLELCSALFKKIDMYVFSYIYFDIHFVKKDEKTKRRS
jgi:hypothetical protein